MQYKITSIELMACPMDISLCIGSLVNDEWFQMANVISMQYAIL